MMSSLKWLQNREKKFVTPVASLAKDIRDVAETITNVWRHFWKSPELELCSNPTMWGSLRDSYKTKLVRQLVISDSETWDSILKEV